MKTILIPTDFSPAALNAAKYGVALAQSINASVVLLHVQEIPVVYQTGDIAPVIDINELEEISRQKLEDLKQNLIHISGDSATIETKISIGFFKDELEAICNDIEPMAVIMATKNTTALERVLLGSNAAEVIKTLKHPVLIVPQGAIYKPIEKVGFACDFKDVDEKIDAANIIEWVKALNAEFNVVHVDKDNASEKPQQATRLFELLKALSPRFHYIESEEISDGIKTFAETHNIGLQIVVYKQYGFFESLFKTSQATELVLHSHIPVLSLPEKD